jgi:hypothetical protein
MRKMRGRKVPQKLESSQAVLGPAQDARPENPGSRRTVTHKHQPSRVWEAGPRIILHSYSTGRRELGRRLVIAGQGEICESRDQVRENDAFHRLKRLPASVDHLFPCIRECGYRIVVVT